MEKATGLRRQYISRVENGRTVPSLGTLEKLAAAMRVPLYRMFYQGVKPPALTQRKFVTTWESTSLAGDAPTARLMRLMAHIRGSDRQLLLETVHKMAQLQRAHASREQRAAAD